LNPDRTLELKAKARQILVQVLTKLSACPEPLSINLRINGIDTEYFEEDLLMLERTKNLVEWNAIFLPKINSATILDSFILSLKGTRYREIVPLAEHIEFFRNSDEIMQKCKELPVKTVQFGHWDYFLSVEEFPTPQPDDVKLWEMADRCIAIAESNEFNYIHTPFPYLMDHPRFRKMAALVDKKTTLPFGLAVLSFSQAQEVRNGLEQTEPFVPTIYSYTEEEMKYQAECIVDVFEHRDDPQYSFNIDNSMFRFCAPHEYLSALRFLTKITHEKN
jgi:hypothetical protein